MVHLTSERSGWGSVRDPETDKYISLDDGVDQEVADRLVDEYGPLSIDDDGDADEDGDGDGDEQDAMLDGTVQEVADAIDSGDYDDQLDEIADRDERVTVQEAVEDRRDAIEEE